MKSLTKQLEEYDDRIDLTPMIDVVFLLLLFFVLTTTFAEETFFPVELPKADQPIVRTLNDAVVIEVTPKGEYACNKEYAPNAKVLFEQLKLIKEERAAGRNPIKVVVIKADRAASAQHLVSVLDILKALEIDEFAVSVKSDDE